MSDKIPRLRYQCRRGMLELDAILQPFFEQHFASLTSQEQDSFERLLTSSDQDLFSWFIGSQKPTDQELYTIILIIKSTHR